MPPDNFRADKSPARTGDKTGEKPSIYSSQAHFLNEAAQLRGNIAIPTAGMSANDRSIQILEGRLQTLLKNHPQTKGDAKAQPEDKDAAQRGWIERLDSKKPNITELKIHYPPKKEDKPGGKGQSGEKAKGTSIKLGLDFQGNLVTIGDELKKEKMGCGVKREQMAVGQLRPVKIIPLI